MARTLVSRGGCLSVVLAAWLAVEAPDAPAAVTMSASATAPTVGADDIAQLVGGADIGGDQGHIWSNRPTQGQSFQTGTSAGGYLLTAVTFRNRDNTATSGTFTVRVGTISDTTISTVRQETAGNAASYVPLDYITATLSTPIWLMPNQLYGVDWGSNGAGFVTCNNWDTAGNLYANGAAYSTGTSSVPGSAVTLHAADRVFHLAMDASSFTTWSGGGATGDWSDSANWAGGVAPSSDSTTSIVISGNVNVGTPAVPLQQNLAAPMVLNRLYVAGAASGDSEVVLGGGALRFEANGTTAPQLIVERSQTVTLQNDLVAAANLTINVFNGAATNDLVIEGQITGDGAITKQGLGTLLLTANNTYTGATTITAGTVQVGNGGTTGTLGTGDVTNNAALVFNRSDNLSVANAIAGSGSVTKLGEGTLTLTATNTMSGGITVNEGTLAITAGAIQGVSSITVASGATLRFGANNLLTSSHGTAESASAHVTIDGGTWVSDTGVCRVGNVNLLNGATWTANVLNTDWGNFYLGALSDTTNATVTVGGTAASQINGTGNIKLGANTQFNVADVTGNAAADLTVSVRLDNQTRDQTQAAGGFTKTGAGTMVLSSTASTYTGLTTVSAGRLLVNGAILGSVTVNGGTLGGTGTMGGTVTVNSGGTHAPGASVGAQVAGGATWSPGGTFQLEVNDATGTAGGPNGWDLLTITNAGGTGTLDLSGLSEANRFTIEIASLAGTTPGAAANFAATVPREWEFVTYQQLAGTFSRDLFTLDATGFSNPLGVGYFDIVQTTSGLAIAFIPEPSTFAMLLVALTLMLTRRRTVA